MTIEEIKDFSKGFPFKAVTIFLSLLKFSIKKYIEFRQYRRISTEKPLPKELKDLEIDEKKYKESNVYSKAKMEFHFVESFFSIFIETTLLVFNYYAFLWELSRRTALKLKFNPNNEYILCYIFTGFEFIRSSILDIPFSYYKTFILEDKFGFNKTTMKIYITDIIKTLILQILFLPLGIDVIIFAIIKGGKYFYVYAEITCLCLVFIFMWAYPNIIAPLFNKFSELEKGEIREKIEKMAEKVEYPLKKIYVVDQSTRSAHSNAYLYGIGKNKRIVLFDTLIKNLLPEEIEAVLGHELGHWKKSHNIKLLCFSSFHIFILFYIFGYFIGNEKVFVSFGFKNISIFIGLTLYMSLYDPISYFVEILQNFLTRICEYEADAFAFQLGYGDLLKSGLKKLFEKNLSDMDPDPLYSAVNHSHPTFIERAQELDRLKQKTK